MFVYFCICYDAKYIFKKNLLCIILTQNVIYLQIYVSVTIGVFHVCFALICANKLCLVDLCLAHVGLVLVHVIGFGSIVFIV